ncbi:MAG: hypothetical protein ACOH1V_02310 [Stenotrophomonas sp.]
MSNIRIAVDADNMLGRSFSEIERRNLPFAIVQACNATAVEIRQQWATAAPRVFDRPSMMTRKAAQYRKATKQKLYADIYLRDEASNGTPPAKYLQTEVEGGQRRKKGFELLLQEKGVMPPGMFAVTGKGAQLDQFGNVRARQISQILSQLGARQDKLQNQSDTSATRRRAKRKRGGEYFALQQKRGRLLPGIYERITTAFGSAVRSIFIFTSKANYSPRYNIFGLAQRSWDKLMPFHFNRELAKALETSKFRGKQ